MNRSFAQFLRSRRAGTRPTFRWVLPVAGADLVAPVAERLRARGVAFGELRVERGRLDDVFRSLTLDGATR